MNLSLFIARKLKAGKSHTITGKILRIASVSVAISLTVMILAIGIVKGFQNEIKYKATGFSGHIILKNLELNQSGEWSLLPYSDQTVRKIKNLEFVRSIEPICAKPGILRTTEESEGMQFKGVENHYGGNFISDQIVRGRFLAQNDSVDVNEIMISEVTAKRLHLDTGQSVELFFIQDGKSRRRKPSICGIFNTGIYEIDKTWALTDIKMIQRIYTLGYDSISGYEIFVDNLNDLGQKKSAINELTGIEQTVQSVDETHFQIFQWLNLLDMNVVIIILLMTIVAIVNMMTALLVLIIDRTPMIGILKALGAENKLIRNTFVYAGARYLLRGLMIGNAIGFGLGILQKVTGVVKLNEETYYLSKVPFEISLSEIVYINVLTFVVCFILLIIPSMYVSRILPVKAIKFN